MSVKPPPRSPYSVIPNDEIFSRTSPIVRSPIGSASGSLTSSPVLTSPRSECCPGQNDREKLNERLKNLRVGDVSTSSYGGNNSSNNSRSTTPTSKILTNSSASYFGSILPISMEEEKTATNDMYNFRYPHNSATKASVFQNDQVDQVDQVDQIDHPPTPDHDSPDVSIPVHPSIMKKKNRPPQLDLSKDIKVHSGLRTPTSARIPPSSLSANAHSHFSAMLAHKRSADSLFRKYRSPSLPSNIPQPPPPVELPSSVVPISPADLHELISRQAIVPPLPLNSIESSTFTSAPSANSIRSKRSTSSTSSTGSTMSTNSIASSSSTTTTSLNSNALRTGSVSSQPSTLMNSESENQPSQLEVSASNPNIPSPLFSNFQGVENSSSVDDLFIVDIRPFAQYATGHIMKAINVCVPSTLLKRPTFTVARFTECIAPDQREKLARLSSYSHIIIYDHSSSELNASTSTSLIYTLLKFSRAEEISCKIYYLRGGISEFEERYPDMIATSSASSPDQTQNSASGVDKMKNGTSLSLSLNNPSDAAPTQNVSSIVKPSTNHLSLPPVLTGFSLPAECKEIGGRRAGFMSTAFDEYSYVDESVTVGMPEKLSQSKIDSQFPEWLKPITHSDGSSIVAKRFYDIEQAERARLRAALSKDRAFSTPAIMDSNGNIQYSVSAGVRFGYKNRYNNIWPYDHSRVVLSRTDSSSCDYINASYISSSWSSKRYIATQAPLPDTFEDFWTVIWEQYIPVIVMLTAESEGGQLKSHPYWQDNNHLGSLKLVKVSEEKVPLGPKTDTWITLRCFSLENSKYPGEKHEVVQIHYTDWPDLGSPVSAQDLLALCLIKEKLMQEWKTSHPEIANKEEPMGMVHCSAGCGRTGTFCAVDSVIDILSTQSHNHQGAVDFSPTGVDANDAKGEDDDKQDDIIYKVVNDFRCQRKSMVQSLRQYALCYETAILWCSLEEQ